jgi:beta-xylosidase
MNAFQTSAPVFDRYFADPFVWLADGVYYAVGTGDVDSKTIDGGPGVFQLLRSTDLRTWTPVAAAMERLEPEFGDSYWAPEVAWAEGRYWLYYSVGREDKGHHLRVAQSERPEGPYRDTGTFLTDPFTCPFAIDASPFQDDDGQWYLFYALDFLDDADGGCVGTGIVVDRLRSMTTLAGELRVVARAKYDWQRFLSNRIMYGRRFDWYTVEGPCVRKRLGKYWCLFSTGRWENETYGVDWAVSNNVEGPWEFSNETGGARLLRTIPGRIMGPGHNSLVTAPDGTELIVYHAWDPEMTARRMFVQPIEWTDSGPRLRY